MKDLILIPILLAAFAFGYYIMTRVDRYVEKNQSLIAAVNRSGQSPVRIAAESPVLLSAISSALVSCSHADPHIAFFLSSGNAERILEKLAEEQVDLVLLEQEAAEGLDREYGTVQLPCKPADEPIEILGLPVEQQEMTSGVCVVWKKDRKSKDLARVIFVLENEYCRLQSGYPDYLG